VLLNGRRVATYGMKGSAVDLNSIPMAAVERVEVLKDGASAVYGTDAIGGVINFILQEELPGLEAEAFDDATQHGGGEHRARFRDRRLGRPRQGRLQPAGDRFAHSENKALRGDQRDFVNTFQPNRGVSVDTRGSPFANVFGVSPTSYGKTLLGTNASGVAAGQRHPAYNGISLLDLPGGAGCNSIDGMGAYDEKLWDTPGAAYGCAWDTGRAAVLQQPVKNNNGLARATFKAGEHQLFAEAGRFESDVGQELLAEPDFAVATTFPYSSFYPSTGAAYNTVYNELVKVFPSIAANYGRRSPTAGAAWSAATARSRPKARPAACRWAPTVR
jgi:iron complex outermembrane receptor protein